GRIGRHRSALETTVPAVNTGRTSSPMWTEVAVRQLRMPLQWTPARPSATGGLVDWANAVRASRQVCLLLGVDGHLVAISEPARALLGDTARPGMSETSWWVEDFPYSPSPRQERSLLARAA